MRAIFLTFTLIFLGLCSKAQTSYASWTCNTEECVTTVSNVVSFTTYPESCTQVNAGTLVADLYLADGGSVQVFVPETGIICYHAITMENGGASCASKSDAVDSNGNFSLSIKKRVGSTSPKGTYVRSDNPIQTSN